MGASLIASTLPTSVAPDGTPIAPYLVLPAQEEAALIHRALPAGASVLELGCGTGRVSRQIADLGHDVHAIDQSREMIDHGSAHSRVTLICADIEELALNRVFDGVVLASYLVNVPDGSKRGAFLAACRRHVAEGGAVIIQRLDPEVYWTPGAESSFGPVRVRLAEAEVRGEFLRAQIEYQIGGQIFPQAVVAEILDDAALNAALSKAGLQVDRWLDGPKTWFVARPVLG